MIYVLQTALLPLLIHSIAKRRPKWEHASTMPVAGIDALCGQSVVFCLQRSIVDPKVRAPGTQTEPCALTYTEDLVLGHTSLMMMDGGKHSKALYNVVMISALCTHKLHFFGHHAAQRVLQYKLGSQLRRSLLPH
jgi:hypothetical protein